MAGREGRGYAPGARSSLWAAVFLVCGVAAVPREAHAQEPADRKAAAAALFDEAMRAERRGDHRLAARLFAQADEMAPNDVTLDAALDAALRADDAVTGLTLADRAEARQKSGSVSRVALEARRRFLARVGRIYIACTGCRATIDGELATAGAAHWVSPGEHRVELAGPQDRTEVKTVSVGAMATIDVAPSQTGEPGSAQVSPPKAPVAPPVVLEPARGPSPAWFWLGVGVTGVASAVAVGSLVDTVQKHDAFEQERTVAASAAGQASQTRTQVLFGVGGALALGTVALGALVVDWSPGRRAPSSLAFSTAAGPGVAARYRF